MLDDVGPASETGPVQIPGVRLQLSILLDVPRVDCLPDRFHLLLFEDLLYLLRRDALFDGIFKLIQDMVLLAYSLKLTATSAVIVIVDREWELLAWTI